MKIACYPRLKQEKWQDQALKVVNNMDINIIFNMALGFLLYKLFYFIFGTLICGLFAKFMPDQIDEVIKRAAKKL